MRLRDILLDREDESEPTPLSDPLRPCNLNGLLKDSGIKSRPDKYISAEAMINMTEFTERYVRTDRGAERRTPMKQAVYVMVFFHFH